jgi:hypothetical protein
MERERCGYKGECGIEMVGERLEKERGIHTHRGRERERENGGREVCIYIERERERYVGIRDNVGIEIVGEKKGGWKMREGYIYIYRYI